MDFNVALGVHLSDPLVSLALGVDVKRPSACLERNDCIFNRKIVRREELLVPLTNFDRVSECVRE